MAKIEDYAEWVKRVAPEEQNKPEPTYVFSNGKQFYKDKKQSGN